MSLHEKYQEQGYAVVPSVLPAALIDDCRAAFAATVKPYAGPVLRQSTHLETHRLSDAGHVVNGLLNCHIPGQCPALDGFARTLLSVVTHERLQAVLRELTGRPAAACMQTMVFDYSPATMAHQDCVYLDSVPSGAMIAAWIALEDIPEAAGRFYVMPLAETPPLPSFTEHDVFGSETYMPEIQKVIDRHGDRLVAPALSKGDVLFWSSRVIHGAFAASDPRLSRKSITAHYVPEGYAFGNVWGRVYRPQLQVVNGMQVRMPRLRAGDGRTGP